MIRRGSPHSVTTAALAPAYFPFYDVNSYALFVTLGGLGCFAALQHVVSAPAHPRWIWLAGVMLGASVWCHQLGVCFVAAVGATLIAVWGRSFLRADSAPRPRHGYRRRAADRLERGLPLDRATQLHLVRLRGYLIEASVEGFWESIGSLLAANTQFWTNPPSAWIWLRVGQLLFVALMLFAVWQWLRAERRVRVGCGMLLVLIVVTATLYSKSRWGVNAGFSRYLIPMCFALPILVGGAVATLASHSRPAALALLVALVLPGINDRRHYIEWEGRCMAKVHDSEYPCSNGSASRAPTRTIASRCR